MSKPGRRSIVNASWAKFIQGGVSIVLGSRDEQNIPSVVRGIGCRISRDRCQVTILVSKSQADVVLNAIRATGAVTTVFTQPSTHTTIQLKGNDGTCAPPQRTDKSLAVAYVDAFVADVCSIGYPEPAIRTILWSDPADVVAVNFTPEAAFLQTPGPRAGEPLGD
jgi:hypothetical protein